LPEQNYSAAAAALLNNPSSEFAGSGCFSTVFGLLLLVGFVATFGAGGFFA
jgi:hypothetical protein